MSFIETCLVALLTLWALGSVLFLVRIPGVHRWLARWNVSRVFVHWSLFSVSDAARRPGTMELLYRDGDPQGNFTAWQIGATGHCHSWSAALWLPERFLAVAVQNIGRDIHWCMQHEPPAVEAARRHAQWLEQYLARRRPLAPGVVREHQLVRRFVSDGTAEPIFSFSTSSHGAGA